MRVALVTGGGRRVGASIVTKLWQKQFNVVIHCHRSVSEAQTLAADLNAKRANSAIVLQADLGSVDQINKLANQAQKNWGQIDVLINNASNFFATSIEHQTTELQWNNLINSNFKGPFFLTQAMIPELKKRSGCIINIIDIHALRPTRNFNVYCAAKAGLFSLTKSFANELAPEIRVNGISPGAILWPDGSNEYEPERKKRILSQIPLKRAGDPQDIANAVLFFINESYITGQILAIDGGRSVNYMDLN